MKTITHLAILLFLCFFKNAIAQPLTPKDYGLKEFTLNDPRLGLVRFYIDVEDLYKKKPLFIEVNGSGGLPLCLYIKGKGFGEVVNSFNAQLQAATKSKYHYVILGKPGTAFCDSLTTDSDVKHYDKNTAISGYKFSKEYTQSLSLEWRVKATEKVITYMIRHGMWDGSKIVAYGYSEGGQVVPSLAVDDKRITHIISIVGSGLNQFYDMITGWRIKAAKGEITQQQAQDSIDASFKQINDIYRHPDNTALEYDGHTYKRWASFGQNPPFEKLRQLSIPIYMIVSTADDHSPIYGLDYVKLDFIRLGKTNLTYDPCVGCDHFLNNTNGGKTVNHQDYIVKIIKWLDRSFKSPHPQKPPR